MPPQAAIVEQLRPCGLRAGDITVRYDEDLQTNVVTVKRSTKVDAQNFICLRYVLFAKADVEFDDKQLRELYRTFESDVSKAETRALARAWLAQHGLLDKLPTLAAGEQVSAVIAKIEGFCGLTAGSALEERVAGVLSWKRSFMTMPPKPGADCLLYALMALDLESVGLQSGFIGNETFVEEKK